MAPQPYFGVIPIEDVTRRHRWLELRFFAWYFLGYSAIVFWAELIMFFFGTLLFYIASSTFYRFAITWCVGLNLILAFLLTVLGLEDHCRARVKRFRQLALRFHPLCAPVWWPMTALRSLVRLATSRRAIVIVPFSRDWVLTETDDDEDGEDVPVA